MKEYLPLRFINKQNITAVTYAFRGVFVQRWFPVLLPFSCSILCVIRFVICIVPCLNMFRILHLRINSLKFENLHLMVDATSTKKTCKCLGKHSNKPSKRTLSNVILSMLSLNNTLDRAHNDSFSRQWRCFWLNIVLQSLVGGYISIALIILWIKYAMLRFLDNDDQIPPRIYLPFWRGSWLRM